MCLSNSSHRHFLSRIVLSRLACLMAVATLCAAQAFAQGPVDLKLDPTFGIDGEAPTSEGLAFSRWSTFALQPDGKILGAGIVATGWVGDYTYYDFVLRRYNADGRPDVFFGSKGRVVTSPTHLSDLATALAIQPDGKIIVAGYSYDPLQPFQASTRYLTLVRYHADGGLDDSFGDGGISLVEREGRATINALAIQPDGKIIVVGGGGSDPLTMYYCGQSFLVARYTSAGVLDRSFARSYHDNVPGIALLTPKAIIHYGLIFGFTNCMLYPEIKSVSLLPDGRILLGGGYLDHTGHWQFVIGQLSRTGKLDFIRPYDNGRDSVSGFSFVQQQRDGKVLALGTKVSRFLDGGELDPTFAANYPLTSGTTQIPSAGGAILPDGKIVHAMILSPLSTSTGYVRVLSIDGKLLGQLVWPNFTSSIHGVLAQPDGKFIVIAGDRMMRFLSVSD